MRKWILLLLSIVLMMITVQSGVSDAAADLSAAIEEGNADEVKRLIAAGVDVNASLTLRRNNLYLTTPLTKAVITGNADIVKLLIEGNADVNAEAKGPSADGPPLIIAAKLGFDQCAKLLIDAGADLNATDNSGRTALFHAMPTSRGSEDAWTAGLEVVKSLIEAGADLNLRDNSQLTPLMVAARDGYEDFVSLFSGSNLDATDEFGRTALILAAGKRRTGVVQILIEAGADVNVKDNFKKTALKMAQSVRKEEIVDLLKKAGAKE